MSNIIKDIIFDVYLDGLSLVSPYSNEFAPRFQKITALLPLPLTSLYSAQNEELTYNESCLSRRQHNIKKLI